VNIHEYQAKAVLKAGGVPVPQGIPATTVNAALDAAQQLSQSGGGSIWVVKAQIHAGGRGKAGGVRVCRSMDEVADAAHALLGQKLVTKQTGEQGKIVHRLYIEQGLEIAREFYLSLLLDREAEAVSFVVSAAGGMDIEAVAAQSPEKIFTCAVHAESGPDANQCAAMADKLGLEGKAADDFSGLAGKLFKVFTHQDCSLLELNPLILTAAGELVALDAKLAVDDNALFRQPDLVAMRDPEEEDPRETEAAAFGLNYIALDGSIGCMVNGAGLAMATMDIIQLKGAKPANFLDVGGGVTEEAVTEAFNLLFSDSHVKAVMVNIFGGIVRCDMIARGLLQAIRARSGPNKLKVPVIMRLVGTNEQEGRDLIRDAGLDVRWANDLDEAASLAAQAAA